MKMKFAKMLALGLIVGMTLTGCGGTASDEAANTDDTAMVYAVEAGSAGEAAAQENGFEYNSVGSQADALMEVASGTSDAAIIDLLMAGAMIGEGTSYPNLVQGDALTTEEYGVGCRKGSDLASYINAVLAESYADGSMQEIADKYGIVGDVLAAQDAVTFEAAETDSDVAYIQDKGALVVGITEFAPMDFKDDNDQWVGFDADMARKVAEKLGVEAQLDRKSVV